MWIRRGTLTSVLLSSYSHPRSSTFHRKPVKVNIHNAIRAIEKAEEQMTVISQAESSFVPNLESPVLQVS